jgi:hypothetical protein
VDIVEQEGRVVHQRDEQASHHRKRLFLLSVLPKIRLSTISSSEWGSRSCVGMNIALVETHKFISQFVHYFEIELADKENP